MKNIKAVVGDSQRIHDHESINQFIDIRVQELALKSISSKTPSALSNVTVRLPKGEIQAIDKLATALDMSRQELLFEIIGTGMDQAIKAFAANLSEESRAEWVKDMIDTWTAFDVELDGEA
jgi:predicted DNA binding CopG/RHH family protein